MHINNNQLLSSAVFDIIRLSKKIHKGGIMKIKQTIRQIQIIILLVIIAVFIRKVVIENLFAPPSPRETNTAILGKKIINPQVSTSIILQTKRCSIQKTAKKNKRQLL